MLLITSTTINNTPPLSHFHILHNLENQKMVFKALPYTLKLILFIPRLLLKLHNNQTKALKRSLSSTHASHLRSQTLNNISHIQTSNLSQKTLIFDVEGTLLRSSSMFPYFMLVAFESGSLIRAFVLFVLYPLLVLVNDELSIKIMVFVSFFGIKKDGFRVGSSVLPKFLLEDVGLEGFDVLKRGKMKVGVSKLPLVMVECFLKDYLEFDHVFGRELTVFGGYFVGLMKDNKNIIKHSINKVLEEDYDRVCFSSRHANHDWIACSKVYIYMYIFMHFSLCYSMIIRTFTNNLIMILIFYRTFMWLVTVKRSCGKIYLENVIPKV